uniref:Uncharacterized protein n=1 Tax=Rhizophora mucronata TaxID=61149 RepID=A0A2P2NU55_RHIMU
MTYCNPCLAPVNPLSKLLITLTLLSSNSTSLVGMVLPLSTLIHQHTKQIFDGCCVTVLRMPSPIVEGKGAFL